MRLWVAILTGSGLKSASMCKVISAGSFSSLSSMFPYKGQRGQFLAAVCQRQGVCVCVCMCVCVCVYVYVCMCVCVCMYVYYHGL